MEESPGSGDARAAAAALPSGGRSPGSGAASPGSSWNSLSPGTPSALTGRVMQRFRPETDPYEKYEARVRKQAAALATLDAALPEGTLDELLTEAVYRKRLHEEAGGDKGKEVLILKREYILEDMDRDGTDDQIVRLKVLDRLLTERQFDVEVLKRQLGKVSQPREPSQVPAAGAVLQLQEKSVDGESMSAKVVQFIRGGRATVSVEDDPSSMCQMGKMVIDCATAAQNKFTRVVVEHQ